MRVTRTYPGVYVEEIPSGGHTISGVETSITAFIGRALKGAVDEPNSIYEYGDFERLFGGLHVNFPMSYAVQDFFLNGGSHAVIVRLFKKGAKSDKASITKDGLKIEAASEGRWGNTLRIRIDTNVSEEVALQYGLAKPDLFSIMVHDRKTNEKECFANLSVKESPRKIDRILSSESKLIRATSVPATVPSAHPDPPVGQAIWTANNCWTNVARLDEADDGMVLDRATYEGNRVCKTGLYALEKVDLFNLLCIPPDARVGDTLKDIYQTALRYCSDRRAILIVDSPKDWKTVDDIIKNNNQALTDLGLTGATGHSAALYFPQIIRADPLRNNELCTFAPCGVVAGIFARTDAARGVWKAPAGIDAALKGIHSLSIMLTDEENGFLNLLGVNCLREFPSAGSVIWGSRTLTSEDRLADDYKYIPVRRTALFIEESLYRGLKWVVFEPNDEPLWAQIRLNVGAFMFNLFRRGAFQGSTPRDAYFVKCDKETTTQDDRDLGVVNILVGFAPLRPAEFVIIKLQQMAGQIQV